MEDKNLIIFHEGNIDWKQAIKLGVSLLVKQGIATSQLADEIIKSTLELGPYYVVGDKVALAHTKSGPYNKKVGLSLVIFKKPIAFSSDPRHLVNLLFCLSTTDASSHMQILAKFANLFLQENLVNEILHEHNKAKLYEIFKGVI